MKKFSVFFVFLSVLVILTSCTQKSGERESEPSTEGTKTKILTEENTVKLEESFEITQNGDALNLSIAEYNRDFRDLYEDNSYLQYFDYEKSFLPYVEVENQFDDKNIFYKIKGYQRKCYHIDESRNKIFGEEAYVNRTLHTFTLKIENNSDKDISLKNFPSLTVILEDEHGNEYYDTNNYCNENGETEFSMTPVYIVPSDNPEAESYDDYLKTTLKANSTNEVTLKYVLDNDLYTSAYLCFYSDNGNKYFKLYR